MNQTPLFHETGKKAFIVWLNMIFRIFFLLCALIGLRPKKNQPTLTMFSISQRASVGTIWINLHSFSVMRKLPRPRLTTKTRCSKPAMSCWAWSDAAPATWTTKLDWWNVIQNRPTGSTATCNCPVTLKPVLFTNFILIKNKRSSIKQNT